MTLEVRPLRVAGDPVRTPTLLATLGTYSLTRPNASQQIRIQAVAAPLEAPDVTGCGDDGAEGYGGHDAEGTGGRPDDGDGHGGGGGREAAGTGRRGGCRGTRALRARVRPPAGADAGETRVDPDRGSVLSEAPTKVLPEALQKGCVEALP